MFARHLLPPADSLPQQNRPAVHHLAGDYGHYEPQHNSIPQEEIEKTRDTTPQRRMQLLTEYVEQQTDNPRRAGLGHGMEVIRFFTGKTCTFRQTGTQDETPDSDTGSLENFRNFNYFSKIK